MKVMVAFLLGMFIAAGIPRSRRALANWKVFVPICLLVAASFYTLRVAG
jgi:hypothetical protein